MRLLRYLALIGILIAPAAYSHAQVSVGIGVGLPVYGTAPVCAYGYYGYYPYACAPYGYYGPSWFSGGIFIGAGPWFHAGYAYPYYRGGYYYGHPTYGYARPGYGASHPVPYGNAVHGNYRAAGGTAFHGGASFHGSGGRR